jgi:hypothetical protein
MTQDGYTRGSPESHQSGLALQVIRVRIPHLTQMCPTNLGFTRVPCLVHTRKLNNITLQSPPSKDHLALSTFAAFIPPRLAQIIHIP